MAADSVLLVGTLTADKVADKRLIGGSISYAVPVFSAFGLTSHLVTSARLHDPILDQLPSTNIKIALKPAEQTTTFENIYQNGERIQHLYSVAQPLTLEDIPQTWRQASYIHLAPLADDVAPAIAAHLTDSFIMLTPQGYMRQWGDDKIIRYKRWLNADMLRHINLLVYSYADMTPDPSLHHELIQHVPHVVVTDGINGGDYFHNGVQAYRYQAIPTQEVDPTGAGDVFASALLATLATHTPDMQAALGIAARVAAFSVQYQGITFPLTPDHIQDFLK